MSATRILLVDDDATLRYTLARVLEVNGFDVKEAESVPDALKLVSTETFDVLLNDLHMPGAGDGLTIVSAMRHANPKAVTMLLSAFPEIDAAAHAIMLQADEIMLKPMSAFALVDAIKQRMASGPPRSRGVESVAEILERSKAMTIQHWFGLVQSEETLTAVPLSFRLRTGHLPTLLSDVIYRLRSFRQLGSKELVSTSAAEHGRTRMHQGYSAAMLVEESRILQVSIFQTFQDNLASIDFSVLLIGVMTIADEVDSQLTQTMAAFVSEGLLTNDPLLPLVSYGALTLRLPA